MKKETLLALANKLSGEIATIPDYERVYKLKVSKLLYEEATELLREEVGLPSETDSKLIMAYIRGIGNIKIELSKKEEFSLELLKNKQCKNKNICGWIKRMLKLKSR